MHLLSREKRLKDKYKDPDVLHKDNKADMAGMMEFIEEYLRSCDGVVRASLAFVIRKAIKGDYPKYVTLDDEMNARMLHLPPDKNRLHDEQSA